MSREVFNAADAATVGPYSHACAGGGLLYLSGQTPIDPATGALVTGSIQAQTRQCLDNLFAVLDAAGLGPGDVINAQVYLVDMHDFAAMNEAYAERFSSPYPARTTIGVASLPLGATVEIGLIAKMR